MEFSSSLTFRAVTLSLRTCARRPFGLDTALTSFPSPPSPARTHGRSGRRCRREASSIMPAATDILSLALTRLRAATTSTLVTNADDQPYCVAHIVCHHRVLEECMKARPRTRGHRPCSEQSRDGHYLYGNVVVDPSRSGHLIEVGVNDDDFVFHAMSTREKFLRRK